MLTINYSMIILSIILLHRRPWVWVSNIQGLPTIPPFLGPLSWPTPSWAGGPEKQTKENAYISLR